MPTAHQYRRAAERSRALAGSLGEHAVVIGRWPVREHVTGGPVAESIGDGLAATARQLACAASDLRAIARECDRRADVCDDHQRRVRAHRELDPAIRALVPPPAPPYGWVD